MNPEPHITPAPFTICSICGARLDSISRNQRCRRCKACRAQHPGKPRVQPVRYCPCGCRRVVAHGRTYADRSCWRRALRPSQKPKAGSHITITPHQHKGRAKIQAPEVGTWWQGLDREAFNQQIAQRFPGVTPPVTVPIHLGAGGRFGE